ncbi:MAG TPA: folate-binding protein [Xanthomonadaceae bacterium]|nr:folate-binding protein [Xanthomonadaceae bacterium]
MSDNPQRAQPVFFALGGGVVELAGPDATRFAQAQTMNDVAALAAGRWQWNGWLTPKGRLVALFALLKFDDARLWLWLPDADAGDFAERLRRFVFRSKLAVAARADLHVAGAFGSPARARGAGFAGDADAGVELDLSAEGGARLLRIATTEAAEDAAALARWRRQDLAHGLPRLDPAQQEQWTPQMLSLDRLRAYSVKKGCYPGQEIVARTHFLGQAKRGLALLHADAPLAAGADVAGADRTLGPVVSVAEDDDATLALAVLPVEREGVALRAGEAALREQPLLDGLAR